MTSKTLLERVDRLELIVLALKVRRWRRTWPLGHGDAPAAPDYVLAFEDAHGEAPASARRVLEETE